MSETSVEGTVMKDIKNFYREWLHNGKKIVGELHGPNLQWLGRDELDCFESKKSRYDTLGDWADNETYNHEGFSYRDYFEAIFFENYKTIRQNPQVHHYWNWLAGFLDEVPCASALK